MPRRVAGSLAVALVLLLAPFASHAQQVGKIYRVGFLGSNVPRPDNEPLFEALRAGLRDRGHVEGRNLVIEFRWAEGKSERPPGLAAELVALPVDVLVVTSTPATRAAKAASRTTPIVFIGLSDPVTSGFVASLARPGGTVTGLTWDVGADQWAKALELIREVAPAASRVAILWEVLDPANPSRTLRANQAAVETGALRLKLALHQTNVHRPEELPGVLAAIERMRVDALYWCFVGLPDKPVVEFAARHRLPAMGCWRPVVASGALMSYAPSSVDLFRRAAGYIDRILKGTKPADLPVEQPAKLEFVINLRTAKTLGLTIPPSVLVRADEVIE